MCSAPAHTVWAGQTFPEGWGMVGGSTSSCWLPGESQNVFNRQNVPVKERRLLACQLFFFLLYLTVVLGFNKAAERYCGIMGADRKPFFCCLKSPHARLRTLAGNHTGLMGWIHIRRVFPCGINAEQATIPSTLPSDVQTATIYLDVFRKSWQSSSPTCFDKVLPREFGGTSDAVELRDNDELW